MMVAKKEKKRIQPQLIFSPVKSASEQDAVAARAKRAMADLGSLKEHSEIAKKLLGPGRKIHVDLSFYQRKEKFVDWKEVCCFGLEQQAPWILCLLEGFRTWMALKFVGGNMPNRGILRAFVYVRY